MFIALAQNAFVNFICSEMPVFCSERNCISIKLKKKRFYAFIPRFRLMYSFFLKSNLFTAICRSIIKTDQNYEYKKNT